MKRTKINFKHPFSRASQSVKNNVLAWDLAKVTKYFVGFGLIILIITAYFWCTRLYMTNERRFWLAIENSMATPSVVRTLTEGGTGNKVVQDYRFHFSPNQVIENKVEFTQKSSTVDTQVVTQGVIFPNDQYLRYVKFINKSEGNFDENIDEVLGQWAHQSSDDEEDARINYLSEYVTLAIFGNFGPNVRSELLSSLKDMNVYNVDYDKAFTDKINDEEVLLYQVTVSLREYAELLNNAFMKAGYGDFPPLNPQNYREGSTLNSQFAIRIRDNSIMKINFGSREEVYSNYGVVKEVSKPDASLSIEELQNTVQTLLQ